MRILIIEDEKLAAEKIAGLISEIDPSHEVLDILDSVDSSIEWLKANPMPDLILSDIHLIDGLCFNIYSEVLVNCPIIFTTAYEKYAIQAFEVNSVDYLLKPIQKEKLEQAIEKCITLRRNSGESKQQLFEEFKALLSQSHKEYKSRFLCKLGNKIKSISVDDIKYFYSESKMTFLVTGDNGRFPVNNTLDEIDQMMDPDQFFRVNRKFIARYDAISEIHPYFKGRLKIELMPGQVKDIIVSSEKASIFKAWLDK
ncbi:MAG: response regulator transcription factor [Saprospiraceae bacterium]|nr:response regulator transcription factor [Saprospiraceae bacterium]